MVFIYYCLHSNALFLGTDSNRHAVLVRTAHKYNVLLARALITGINICWNVHARQMPNVNGSVCVGKCRSYEIAFWSIGHIKMKYPQSYIFSPTKRGRAGKFLRVWARLFCQRIPNFALLCMNTRYKRANLRNPFW